MDDMQQPIDPTTGHTDAGHTDPARGPSATGADAGGTADEGFAWSNEDQGASDEAKASGEKMLGQLQGMIDSVATQATPMARQIGIKAAELAAAAADRAGPFAQRAADATVSASLKFAEQSRQWAADLRSKTVEEGGSNGNGSSDSSVAVAEPEAPPTDQPGGTPLDQG